MFSNFIEKFGNVLLRFLSYVLPLHLFLAVKRYIFPENTQIKFQVSELANLLEQDERYLLPSFERSELDENDRYSYQKQYVNFTFEKGAKILDIGSGDHPFQMATHLADLHDGETSHRARPIIMDRRHFYICNIENFPYKDNAFDYVYCCHILEHVTDPAKACEEIMRIGKRGYIETPTRMSDIMMNFTKLQDHHKWYVNLLGDTLIFQEWTERERRDTGCNDFFKMFISRYKNPFQTLFYENADLFVNMLTWTDKFYYYVFDKNGRLLSTNRDND